VGQTNPALTGQRTSKTLRSETLQLRPAWECEQEPTGSWVMTVRATWNDVTIAESDHTVVVEGNHYFPPGSVRTESLAATNQHTFCPWKGRASYYDVMVDGSVSPSSAWYYPKPFPFARKIRNHVAFSNNILVEEHP